MGLIRTTVLVGAAALLAATPTLADNTVLTPEQTKVLHKLQERCGKDAAEFVSNVKTANDGRFPQLYPGTPDVEFQNYYSSRFNKCLVWTFVSGREMLGNARLSGASVWSATDNRVIGDFVTIIGVYLFAGLSTQRSLTALFLIQTALISIQAPLIRSNFAPARAKLRMILRFPLVPPNGTR